MDGGSADDTCGIVRAFGGRIYRFISEPDAVLYDALNKGIKAASGEIVGIMHSGDL